MSLIYKQINNFSDCFFYNLLDIENIKTNYSVKNMFEQLIGELKLSNQISQKYFLNCIKTQYFDRGGHISLPYFINNKYEFIDLDNGKYKNLFKKYYFDCDCEQFKRLMKLTFHFITENNNIIEFVFDKNIYNDESMVEMINTFKSINEKEILNNIIVNQNKLKKKSNKI